jgi:membrane protease YdiL (CAAX protease family)
MTVVTVRPDRPAAADTRTASLLVWMRRHPVISYFVIAYALSWGVWIPMVLAGATVTAGRAWPSHVPGLLGPLVAACLVSAVVGGSSGLSGLLGRIVLWRTPVRWYLVAVSPVAFYAAAVIAGAALGKSWADLADMGEFSGLPVVTVPVMALLLVATGYAEEAGWRGFAAHELLKTRSLLWAAVVIGLLWALWHIPSMFLIDSYRQMGMTLVPMFTLGMVSGSIVLAWLYRGSGGSVLLVALWHGFFNLVSGTTAATGLPAATASTAVMVWAVIIVIAEVRRERRASAPRSRMTSVPVSSGGGG